MAFTHDISKQLIYDAATPHCCLKLNIYSVSFLNSKLALCPPKPKLLLMAY